MKVLLVDDEQLAIQTLEFLLNQYFPTELEIIGRVYNIVDAKEIIDTQHPDLVFLDIMMPKGDGFELLESVKDKHLNVIFLTAYNEFAVKAFKFSAIDYLLKPVDADELIAAVRKALKSFEEKQSFDYSAILENIKQERPRKIVVSNQDGINFINVDDIYYLEAEGSYVSVHMTRGRKVILSKLLKEYEDLFQGYDFFRIHKSFLINLKYVERFNIKDGGYIEMENGAVVPISRRKKDIFFQIMNNFTLNKNN
jgi:two-component system LytT family response regulator